MSKTDKTRPWRVRRQDHEVKRPRLTQDDPYLSHCTYKWWLGEMRCGCPMCTDQYHRKQMARKRRRAGRAECRDLDSLE